jgi:hypothetical protein
MCKFYNHALDANRALTYFSVTIQPQGTTTSQNTNQSTAQFASTFVAGTLKRAFGTVTETVTSFINGNDTPAVVYTPNGSNDNVHVVRVVLPEVSRYIKLVVR